MLTPEQRLRDENETLRERVRQLEEALAGSGEPQGPLEKLLTNSQLKLFRALVKREMVSLEAAFALLYLADGKDTRDSNTIRVFVYQLRRKLARFGIEIELVWGRGYKLTAASRQRIAELEAAATLHFATARFGIGGES